MRTKITDHQAILLYSTIEALLNQFDQENTKGFVCAWCNDNQPASNYFYTAYNSETKEEVKPLCAFCIRGQCERVMGPPWKHNGPFKQT